ncbi:hypothetical protein [Streptomyces sp. NPDC005507]|uniref:hypothetical protein n=1 Tax=Streptomyces sp. NPDC005507 TaxID=3154885 RepID=UPI0033AA9239
MKEADELRAGGGSADRDGGAVDGAEFGEARQFVLVEAHGFLGARGQVIARDRAVQLLLQQQQRRLDGFGDRTRSWWPCRDRGLGDLCGWDGWGSRLRRFEMCVRPGREVCFA